MAVTAGKVRGPLAGPGGQVARPCIQLKLAVRCIPPHPEELHPLLVGATRMPNRNGQRRVWMRIAIPGMPHRSGSDGSIKWH